MVTTTSVDTYNELETPAVYHPLTDADYHGSEIASAMAPGNSEVLTLKHNDHTVFSMRASDGPRFKVRGTKLSPDHGTTLNQKSRTCSRYCVQKAEGLERRTRPDLLERTWKSSVWLEGDDEEHKIPLVYSFQYTQQSPRGFEVYELPHETVG